MRTAILFAMILVALSSTPLFHKESAAKINGTTQPVNIVAPAKVANPKTHFRSATRTAAVIIDHVEARNHSTVPGVFGE